MRFSAVTNETCATPKTCGNGNLMVAGLQVQRDPAIMCLRSRPLNKAGGKGHDGITGLSTAGMDPEFEGALVEGASVEEKMAVLEKFAFRNEYLKTWADAVKEL